MGKRKEDENQLNLFDWIVGVEDQVMDEIDLPILLHEGDIIWKVDMADVTKYTVTSEKSWTVGDSFRGYRIQNDNGTYNVASNDSIGISFFFSEEEAKFHAERWAKKYEMIWAKEIRFSNIEAYSFVRECDDYKMVAFQAEIGNGLLYEKNFYTYAHIVKDTPKNRKAFLKDIREKYTNSVRVENIDISAKNMYRCQSDSGWEYAESGYTGTRKYALEISCLQN